MYGSLSSRLILLARRMSGSDPAGCLPDYNKILITSQDTRQNLNQRQ